MYAQVAKTPGCVHVECRRVVKKIDRSREELFEFGEIEPIDVELEVDRDCFELSEIAKRSDVDAAHSRIEGEAGVSCPNAHRFYLGQLRPKEELSGEFKQVNIGPDGLRFKASNIQRGAFGRDMQCGVHGKRGKPEPGIVERFRAGFGSICRFSCG